MMHATAIDLACARHGLRCVRQARRPQRWTAPGRAGRGPAACLRQPLKAALLVCGLLLQLCTMLLPRAASAAGAEALKRLSLEELLALEVTSVSKMAESLSSAAAAVSVITGEDIRRSGVTTIPEALRGIPGIHVARRNSNSWAVSSRGFSSVNSEKLLVLSDTRSLYTPLFSGVFWDTQDYLMADIERIEVIRGPGAALWGSNAVNGVINITTKPAAETQDLYLELGSGSEEQALLGARYGGRLRDAGHFRVFGKYFDRDASSRAPLGRSDDWRMGHAGFRTDWDMGESDALTVQGDLYRGDVGQLAPAVSIIGRQGPGGDLNVRLSGGNVLGRWQHRARGGAELQLRLYYDRTHRDDPSFEDELDTVDLDLQQTLQLARHHDIVWGLNYRNTRNDNRGKVIFALDTQSSRDEVVSGFVQDQIALRESLRLTLGTKLEHNDFSGTELQPSARLAWDVSAGRVLWGSVSRAARVPTRLERDIAIDVSDPAGNPLIRLVGNEDFDAEELTAYELGYRWRALESLSFDLALFHHRYQGLAALELGTPFIDAASGRLIVPLLNRNFIDGDSQGVELFANLVLQQGWRVSASYAYVDVSLDPAGQDLNRARFHERSTPRHDVSLRSSVDLPAGFELDAHLRHSTAVRSTPEIVSGPGIAAYSELDLRLGWRAGEHALLSIVGQNLLHERHVEAGSAAARGAIERGIYGKVEWRF